MRRASILFLFLLIYAVLALWVPQRWAWSLFQIAIFFLAAWRFTRPGPWRTIPAVWPLCAAAVWPWIQFVFATSVSACLTLISALDWVTFLAAFALATDLLADPTQRDRFLRAAALFSFGVAALATVQLYSSGGRIFWLFPSGYAEGVLGSFVNRGQYSAWIELLLPIAACQAIFNRRYRFLYTTASAVMFASIIAAASRAGFLIALTEIFAVLTLAACRNSAPRKTLITAVAQLALLTTIAVTVAGWQNLQQRFHAGLSDVLRVDAARASLQMIRDRPWTGSGLGTWSTVYPAYADIDTGLFVNQAHNDWLQWAAEGGVPFLFFLFAFAALLCKPAIRSICGLGIVAFLLHALVDFPMQQRPGLAVWLFAVAGAVTQWDVHRDRGL